MQRRSDIIRVIDWAQTVVTAIVVLHSLVLVAWACGGLVPGWARYNGTPGRFNALGHGGFWLGIEIVTLVIGAIASGARGNIGRQLRWLMTWIVFLVLAIVANIVHIIATIYETLDCTSILCVDYQGFIVGLFIILGLAAIVESFSIYYASLYRKYLYKIAAIKT